jgi:uncharacterized protein
MGKALVLILLVVFAVWLVKRALRNAARQDEAGRPPAAPQASEELVRCAHCGLLLPRGEARQAGGAIYCGEEHAKLGKMRAAEKR